MLNEKIKLSFVGGDKRQVYAAERLGEIYEVSAVGENFEAGNKYHFCDSILKACHNAKIIILPLPANKSDLIVDFDSLLQIAADNNALVFGGMLTEYMKCAMEGKGIEYRDYFNDEIFTLSNAYITAEGALFFAMNALDQTMKKAKIAIVGYGKIGSALGEILTGIGCKSVTVFARRAEVLTLASERGLLVKKLSERDEYDFDVVFNTVPSRVISNKQLLEMKSGTVLIELASAPGGFDREIGEQSGIKVVNATGIPGKYAPRTAGDTVAEAIKRLIDKEVFL